MLDKPITLGLILAVLFGLGVVLILYCIFIGFLNFLESWSKKRRDNESKPRNQPLS